MNPFRLCLALGLAALAAVETCAREKWLYARTQHFEMLSCASERVSRRTLLELEQFRANFVGTFHLPPAHEPRTTVVLFGTDRQFRPYKPLYKGKPKEVAGYFVGGADEVMIAMTTAVDSEYESSTEIIFHEYVHLLLHAHGMRPPLWVNEGLAELYSTFAIARGTFEFGQPKELYVYALQTSPLIPLRKLFAVTEESPDYNEEHRASMFYAQSWALMHYLVCGTDQSNRRKLVNYLNLLSTTTAGAEAAFEEAFGLSYERMEGALREYLRGGQFFLRSGPVQLTGLEKTLQFRPATDLEREATLIQLRSRAQAAPETAHLALQLAEKHPESPRPYEILGSVAMQGGDMYRALEYWRKAVERETENPFIYTQVAAEAVRQALVHTRLGMRWSDARVGEMRTLVDRALRTSPDYLEAYEVLACVEAHAPQVRVEAVNRIQTAVRRMKDPSRTLLALAILRSRFGDHVTANQILAKLLDSPSTTAEVKDVARMLQTLVKEWSVAGAAAP